MLLLVAHYHAPCGACCALGGQAPPRPPFWVNPLRELSGSRISSPCPHGGSRRRGRLHSPQMRQNGFLFPANAASRKPNGLRQTPGLDISLAGITADIQQRADLRISEQIRVHELSPRRVVKREAPARAMTTKAKARKAPGAGFEYEGGNWQQRAHQ